MGKGLTDPDLLQQASTNLFSLGFLKFIGLWYIFTTLTLVALQVNDKYGPGVFVDLLKGKYHRPRTEHRIFMFLDLKNSTTIAENIGHARYFELLRSFFEVITDAIINSNGEIYQYVGDEIVISWSMDKGLTHANALNCFFEMKSTIKNNELLFLQTYQTVPEFKAGVHAGAVTVGEIGIIKKDIVYSGDVLNTAARLMELCKTHNKDIVVSGEIHSKFSHHNMLLFEKLGVTQLRGKEEPIELYTVNSR